MPYEQMIQHSIQYNNDLRNGTIQKETILENIRNISFSEPKTPKAEVLKLLQKYDPEFAPVTSEEEIQRRRQLTQQAQEGIMNLISNWMKPVNVVSSIDYSQVKRHHSLLLQECTTAEDQKSMEKMLYGTNKQARTDYYFERFSKMRRDLFAMLEMNDEQLLEHFFQHSTDLELAINLETILLECDFDKGQLEDLQPFFDKQTELTVLKNRIDLISSPFYAEFPCERLNVSAAYAQLLKAEMDQLALQYGENVAVYGAGAGLSGPTSEMMQTYSNIQAFALGILENQVNEFLKPHGSDLMKAHFATISGKAQSNHEVLDNLQKDGLVFFSVPGKAVTALYNASTNPRVCQPAEATPEVIKENLLRQASSSLNQINKANPFLLSVFTGSKQYDRMARQFKTVRQSLTNLEHPLSPEAAEQQLEALMKLGASCNEYLEYKKAQGLEEVDGVLQGRSDNERTRIAAAMEAKAVVDALTFQMQYYINPELAGVTIETAHQERQEQLEAKQREQMRLRAEREQKLASQEKKEELKEQDKSTASREEMYSWANGYKTMPACAHSDIGDALEKARQGMYSNAGMIAMIATRNQPIPESYANNARVSIARMVLFNCALRERQLNAGADPIVAGPIERQLGIEKFVYKLAESEEFKKLIGDVTPARLEAFLKNHEEKMQKFDAVVLNALAPEQSRNLAAQPTQKELEVSQMEAAAPVHTGP